MRISRWRRTRPCCWLACATPRRGRWTPAPPGAWPDEFAVADLAAAHERLDRLASNPLALMRAKAISIEQVVAANDVFVAQVDDPEVRVEARRDVALVQQPEPPRDVRRRGRRDHGWVQVWLRQHQLPRRLTARDSAPNLCVVVALLE